MQKQKNLIYIALLAKPIFPIITWPLLLFQMILMRIFIQFIELLIFVLYAKNILISKPSIKYLRSLSPSPSLIHQQIFSRQLLLCPQLLFYLFSHLVHLP